MEEEIKEPSEINPDALDAVFEDAEVAILEEDEEILLFQTDKTELDADEIDLAFQANDEGYW